MMDLDEKSSELMVWVCLCSVSSEENTLELIARAMKMCWTGCIVAYSTKTLRKRWRKPLVTSLTSQMGNFRNAMAEKAR